MKIKKGEYGYIRSQKKIRVIRTIVAFAFDFAIFFLGLYLNKGDRRNSFRRSANGRVISGCSTNCT